MENTLIYLFQASICLAVFYIAYWIFFSRNTFFKINRIYLLISILISVIIPFFNFKSFFVSENYIFSYMLDPVNIYAKKLSDIDKSNNFFSPISLIYISGFTLFSALFIYKLFRISRIIRKFGINKIGRYKFVFIDNLHPSFSFLNLIFISKTEDNNEYRKIADHEKIHIKQFHTFDILLLEIITIVFWFNPILLAYKNSIKGVHEYLADKGVLNNGHKTSEYQQLLLSLSFGLKTNALTNNFNHLLIKKRFIMMTKIKTPNWSKLRYLLIIPVFVALFIAFSCSENSNAQAVSDNETWVINEEFAEAIENKNIQAVLGQDTVVKKGKEVFNFYDLDEKPEFPDGGLEGVSHWVAKNTTYPEIAKEKGISGKVFVQFIIEKNGSVSNVKVMRSVNKHLDKEAVRVIKLMPKWKPGKHKGKAVKVVFQLPINFKLK